MLFDESPDTVQVARDMTDDFLTDAGAGELVDDARPVVSELVGNADEDPLGPDLERHVDAPVSSRPGGRGDGPPPAEFAFSGTVVPVESTPDGLAALAAGPPPRPTRPGTGR
ncbi:hypothetical protein [Streptomyces antibioticus]|uniref:hypothetical protein n=1 Tax=Streptomyces antibioticus TaxID=1890 RepID=UPI0036FDDAEB